MIGKKAYINLRQPLIIKAAQSSPPGRARAFMLGRCPRCRRGRIFHGSSYSRSFQNMNKKCPHCEFKFEIEPGFFWGAMYLNYGFSVLIAAITGICISLLYPAHTVWHLLAGISAVIFLTAPMIFRLSRLMLIYFLTLIRFKPTLYYKNVHKHN